MPRIFYTWESERVGELKNIIKTQNQKFKIMSLYKLCGYYVLFYKRTYKQQIMPMLNILQNVNSI